MKAFVLNKFNEALEKQDLPICEPGDLEVRIKVSACGLCFTDKHIVSGELKLKKLPLIPGHQIVGTIDKLGAKVHGFKLGDLVGVTWLNKTCGRCEYCNMGSENLCEKATFTGYDVDGGFAEYTLAYADYIIKLPQIATPPENLAPLLCAGLIGYRSYKLSQIKPLGKIGLIGFGASAHIVIQIAKHFQCEVYVFTRKEHHKKLAESLKADFVGDVGDFIDCQLDAIILFAPCGEFVPTALSYLKKGGKLIINAICMSEIPSIKYDLIYGERVMQSATNVTREDMKEFIDLALKIPIKTKIEKRPMSEINLALEDLKNSNIAGALVLIP
jgi:propanol-preferring alcohol dehydrogenase